MRADVHKTYTVLSRCRHSVYGSNSKWRGSNELPHRFADLRGDRPKREHTLRASFVNASNQHRRSIRAVRYTPLRSLRSSRSQNVVPPRILGVYSNLSAPEK
jgi:hypothetical protein